jgi:RHS repeat-associated protein
VKSVLALIWTFLLVTSVGLTPALGQTPDLRPIPIPSESASVGLWSTTTSQGSQAYAGSAEQACRIQMAEFNPNATFQAPTYVDDDDMSCKWLAKQFGGPPNSNTILPSLVRLVCSSGFRPARGQCVEIPDANFNAHCDCENGGSPASGTPQLRAGNPISVNSGFKVLDVTDYETADGLLRVDRSYLSRQGDRWKMLFPGFLEMDRGGDYDRVLFYSRFGGADTFTSAARDGSNWTWILPSFFGTPESYSRRRLSMVTTPTVTRSVWANDTNVTAAGAAEMRLDMATGEYILFRRVNDPSRATTKRLLVPVEHGIPGGYVRYFDYNDDSPYPYRVRDSLNRILSITWQDAPGDSVLQGFLMGKVITQIGLPDGTRLDYSYDKAADFSAPPPDWAISANLDVRIVTMSGVMTSATPTSSIVYDFRHRSDRLRIVQLLDTTGAVRWKRTYDYGEGYSAHNLLRIRDQNDAIIATYSYAGGGRLASSALAGGVNAYSYQHLHWYENGVRLDRQQARRVTGPLGRTDEYYLYRRDSAYANEPVAITQVNGLATPTTPADSQIFSYNNYFGTKLLMTRSVDQLGRETSYALDLGKGRPNSITEAPGTPLSRSAVLQWHPTLDLPTRIERDRLQIDTVYTTDGLVASQTLTDITTTTVPYSTNGQTRTTTYTWGSNSRLLSINGPRAPDAQGRDDIDSFTYDASGNLTQARNALGHTTTYSLYDPNGRPGQMTDANGIVTLFTYDPLGRLLSSSIRAPGTSTAHATTSYAYDLEGRIISITRPATATLNMAYDLAGRLLSISTPTGERIDYSHDAMGNVLTQTVKRTNATTASSITRTFDALGRMLTETLGTGRTWAYTYDPVGNQTRFTSPRNFPTTQAFDALSRLISVAAPDGGTSTSSYNSFDDQTSFTDPVNVTTQFTLNGFGDVIQEVSPDRGTTITTYDVAGTVASVTDGRGQRIDYTRDILGRVLTRTPAGLTAQRVTYIYDTAGISGSYGVGRLASVTDASGTTKFKYDHRGNILTRQQGILGSPTITLAMTYDLADRITRITYPSGRWVNYARDTRGRVLTVTTRAAGATTTTTLLSAAVYEPFGALTTATLGNTQRFAQIFDNTGRGTHRRYRASNNITDIWSVAYDYDADDNIASITDLVDPSRTVSHQYDGVNRLARVDTASGSIKRFDYIHDLGGNRVRLERRTAANDVNPTSQDNYIRTPGTNRIASITTAAGARSFTHDARGNLSAEDRPGTNDVTVGYDGYARLTSYARTGEANLAMAYNGMDQRVALTSGGVTRRFVQDGDGRMLGEYAANGTQPFAEYIWLLPEVEDAGTFGGDDGTGGWTPLAVSTANGAGGSSTLHWLHTTHLGVPTGSFDAGGTSTSLNGITLLGFPGQQQTLVDLYYNQYRDYDPTTGRYIQADPIGLDGDVNPYVYAGANPVNAVDPIGFQAAAASRAAWDVAVEEGLRHLGRSAVRPTRRIPLYGQALLLGDVLGTCAAVVYYGAINPPVLAQTRGRGGTQNLENEWNRAARRERPHDVCGYLQDAYRNPSTTAADRQKIKTAQKVFGCRRRG